VAPLSARVLLVGWWVWGTGLDALCGIGFDMGGAGRLAAPRDPIEGIVMSLTCEQLADAPRTLRHRVAELVSERSAATSIPGMPGDEIARVRSEVGDAVWSQVVSEGPALAMAEVDAVALALGTTAEWLLGGDDSLRARPSLNDALVAGMARHRVTEIDVADALGLSLDGLEGLVASPHLADPALVADFHRVLAP